jgi:hypothetical protein
MAKPEALLNPNDPIVQVMRAEANAKLAYNSAGYHRNFLEQKAKEGDAAAKAELPEAQREVEEAQERVKRAQILLAQLTGTPNPHAIQKVARRTPEKPEEIPAVEKSGPKKSGISPEEKKYRQEENALATLADAPLKPKEVYGDVIQSSENFYKIHQASFESRASFSILKFVDQKKLREEVEKFIKEHPKVLDKKRNIPQNGEMIRLLKTFEARGESAMLMEHSSKLRQGMEVFLRMDK